jgi:hypothetical protein
MKRSFFRLLPIFILLVTEFATVAAKPFPEGNKSISGTSEQNGGTRRRKPGRGKSMFDELEIFKHNADIFVGPAYHMGNGDFFTYISESEKSLDQKNFNKFSISATPSFLSVAGGIQYRIIPNHKDRGFASMISYAAGLSIFKRGYDLKYTKSLTLPGGRDVENGDVDNIEYSEKVRATYLSIPVSARIGRRLFIEAGLGLNFMVHGISDAVLIRSNVFSSDPGKGYSYDYPNKMRLKGILPFFSPGLNFSTGFHFNENLGFRISACMVGGFFKNGTNPPDNQNFNSTIFSLQLLGCIN